MTYDFGFGYAGSRLERRLFQTRPVKRLQDPEPSKTPVILGGPDQAFHDVVNLARINGIDPELAVLVQWGKFEITRQKCFSLVIGEKASVTSYKTGDRVTNFVYDGQNNVAGMTVRQLKDNGLWEHVVEVPTVPASGVQIQMGSGKEFVYAICDLGVMGKIKLGVSRDGSFETKWI